MADDGSKPNVTILDFRWIYKDLLILSFSCLFGLFTYVFFFYDTYKNYYISFDFPGGNYDLALNGPRLVFLELMWAL